MDTYFDNVDKNKSLSIAKKLENGMEFRRTFAPGEIDEVEKFAPELTAEIKEIWLPSVIAAWEEEQAKQI